MPETPKWNDDIVPHLDPMMPQAQYDAMRQHYFQAYVAPTLRPEQLAGGWDDFKSKTERPPLLSPTEKILTQAGIAATAGTKEMLGVGSPIPQVKAIIDKIDTEQKWMKDLAAREGMGTGFAEGAGSLAGMSLPLEGLLGVAGKVAPTIARAVVDGVQAQEVTSKILRGGLAFATFDAASDEHGDRLTAGLKGGAIGAAGEILLLPFTRSGEAAESTRRAVTGETKLPPPQDATEAQNVAQAVDVAKKEGRLQTPVVETRNVKNLNVTVTDAKGTQQVLPIVTGREDAAYAKIKEILDNGGSIDSIQHNPKQQTRAAEFIRRFGDEVEPKYTSTVKVAANVPKAVVERAKSEGVPIRETEGGVELPVEPQSVSTVGNTPTAPKVEISDHELDEMLGPRETAPSTLESDLQKSIDSVKAGKVGSGLPTSEPFHGEQSGEKPTIPSDLGEHFEQISNRQEAKLAQAKRPTAPMELSGSTTLPRPGGPPVEITFPDRVSEALYRTGELRQRAQMSGMPDPFHRRMNEMMGTLAEVSGIPSREEAGRAALQYFDETNLAAKSAQGTSFTAESQIDRLREFGEKLGGTRGERPDPLKSVQARRAAAQTGSGPTLAGPAYSAEIDAHTPGTENIQLNPSESIVTQLQRSGNFRVRPEGASAVVSDIEPGVRGATVRTSQGPFVLVKQGASAGDVFHEWLHSGIEAIKGTGYMPYFIGEGETQATGRMLASAIGRSKAYRGFGPTGLLNEAFVHAATAVRMNDGAYLEKLAAMDTDLDHVLQFVSTTSKNLLEHSREQIDSAPGRILQRRLEDVARRSSSNVTDVIGRAVEKIGGRAHYDPSLQMWLVTDSEGRESAMRYNRDVMNWIERRDPQDMLPSVSFSAEVGGVRGPIAPEGTAPLSGNITPELEPGQVRGLGISAITGLFRPMLPWVASLDQKLNNVLEERIPLFDTVKAVDQAHIAARDRMNGFVEQLSGILKGTGGAKQKDVFELLTHDPGRWDDVAEQLKLSPQQTQTAQKIVDWAGTFKEKTGIDVMHYLQDLYPELRENDFDSMKAFGPAAKFEVRDRPAVDFWQRAIANGKIEPRDTQLGRLLMWSVRQDFNVQMHPALKELEDLLSFEKDKLGPTHWTLNNYANYMRGIPDLSGQMVESFTGDFLKFAGDKSKQLNKYLPAGMKLPENWGMPRAAIARLTQLSYAGGLAGRPATLLRDLFAGMNSMYVMGPMKYASGLMKALTSKGWSEARANGWLLEQRNIGEMYGDILGDIEPSKINQVIDRLMWPNSAAHNIGRAAAGHASYDAAIDAITKYRAGKIGDPIQVLKDSGGWWADKPMQSRFLQMIQDANTPEKIQDVARAISNEVVDNTQWALRKGTQGAILRTGMGRVFGQYSSYPMNYLDFVRRMVSKAREYPDKGLPALGAWTATQYAAYAAAENSGVDISKWVGLSSAGYSGGPQLEAIMNMMRAPENSQQGREARKQLLEYPLNFVPGNAQIQNILKIMDSNEAIVNDGSFGPGFVRLLGFKPLPELENDPTFDEWFKMQAGFGRGRNR